MTMPKTDAGMRLSYWVEIEVNKLIDSGHGIKNSHITVGEWLKKMGNLEWLPEEDGWSGYCDNCRELTVLSDDEEV
jgi:hypothetical protein